MENTAMNGTAPTAYDYHLYDQVWKRVNPDLEPYPEVRPAGDAPQPRMAPPPETGEDSLPGAEENPCCMGTEARDDLDVVSGFIEDELAGRRCCLALAQRVCRQDASRLLRRIAMEKREAAKELSAAYYLITGECYTPAIAVEHMRWDNLCLAMRSCYHQEACGGFNYQRAADATGDLCLQQLFTHLSECAYRRARDVMDLLGKLLT